MRDNEKISIHHIGGRAGSRAFPHYGKFEKDIINVMYDADSDCISQICDANKALESELIVLPYCVGSYNKKMKFYINYDPYTSSLLKMNPEFGDYYSFQNDHDYIISDTFRAMEERELEVNTLDDIIALNDNIPPPDFLSLDTQGSEYDILQGAEKTLSENVLAVVLEVEFQPIYKGQKLFGEIQTFLSNHDFTFVRFLGIQEYSPHRASIGIRGNGFQCCADALFLRRCGSIDPHDKNGQIMLIKLAFFSILFNQTEYALLCLSMMDDLKWGDKQNNFESVGIKYLRFINELKYLKKGLNPCYPPTFPMKYSYEDSKRRFSKDNQRQTENNYGLAKRLGLYLFSKSALIKKIYFSVKATFILILKLPKITKKFLLQKGDTSIELLFRKYGLIEQADKIRSIRNKQQQYCTDKSAV